MLPSLRAGMDALRYRLKTHEVFVESSNEQFATVKRRFQKTLKDALSFFDSLRKRQDERFHQYL